MTKTSGLLQSTPIVEPGYMLGVDLMGPFPKSNKQHEYLLVVVDYFTKWVELFPLRTARASHIAKILIDEILTDGEYPPILCQIEVHSLPPSSSTLSATVGGNSKINHCLPSSNKFD